MNNSYRILIYDDLSILKHEYMEFENKTESRAISTSFEWVSLWDKCFKSLNNKRMGSNRRLIVCFLFKNNEIIAIAPLYEIERKFGRFKLKTLEFIGQQRIATYCDILSLGLTKYEIDYLFSSLLKKTKCDLIFLNHIPEFSRAFKHIKLYPYEVCPEVSLFSFGDFEEYIKTKYSKNLKQNIRTAKNRAKKNKLTLNPHKYLFDKKVFDEVIRIAKTKILDKKSFKYSNPHIVAFREEVMSVFKSNVTSILLDDKMVAYRINILYKNTKFCIDASYDREYPKYNLGALSVDFSIKNSFEEGYKYHCEGPGLDYYKTKFATNYVKLNYYLRRGNTVLSHFLYPVIKIAIKMKSMNFNNRFVAIRAAETL